MAELPFVIKSRPRARFATVDDAVSYISSTCYPVTMEQLSNGQSISGVCHAWRVGPLILSDSTYDIDVRLDFGDLRDYHVNVPLSGSIQSRHRNVDVAMNAEVGGVYQPEGETTLTRWAKRSRNLGVKIDRGAVAQNLSVALPGISPETLTFVSSIDLRSGHGRSWMSLLKLLVRHLNDADSVLHHPMTATPFAEAIVNGFLLIGSPDYREALDRAAKPSWPAAIRSAVDIIHDEAHTR